MDICRTATASPGTQLHGEPPLAADDVYDPAYVVDEPEPDITTDRFINRFKRPLQDPVLHTTPPLRTTKAIHDLEDDEWIPKRSARLAAKSKFREAKPEAQARKVMMKKLGLQIETKEPDEASFDEFHTAFRQPLSPTVREALQVLFPGRMQRALGAVRAA
jgi:hypothetical protein